MVLSIFPNFDLTLWPWPLGKITVVGLISKALPHTTFSSKYDVSAISIIPDSYNFNEIAHFHTFQSTLWPLHLGKVTMVCMLFKVISHITFWQCMMYQQWNISDIWDLNEFVHFSLFERHHNLDIASMSLKRVMK